MKKALVLLLVLWLVLVCPLGGQASDQLVIDSTALFDQHGAVILIADPQTGDIIYANDAAAAFYGYDSEQLKAMNMSQISAASPEDTVQELQGAASSKESGLTLKHRLASGETRDVEVLSYPVQADGKTLLFSIVHDVTEEVRKAQQHNLLLAGIFIAGGAALLALLLIALILLRSRRRLKESKEAIEQSEMQHKTFIDADDSLIYLKDENLKYIFVNKAFEEFYGRKEAEVVGLDDFALSSQEEAFAKQRRKTDMMALNEKGVVTDEFEWNGKIHRTLKFPVLLPSGKTGVGAYVTDITYARRNEKKQEKALIRHKILADMIARSFDSRQSQLDYVLHEALKLTESQFGYIYLYDEEEKVLTLNSWTRGVMESCTVTDQQTVYPLEKTGLWGEVVRQRKPIVENDFSAPNPLKKGYPEGHVPIERFMSAPVIIDDKIVAIIGMANKPIDYDENDVYETILLMGGVWNAVARRDSQEKLAFERNRFQQTLLSIGDGVMVVDKDGKVEMLNPVAESMTGWTLETARGMDYTEIFRLSHEQPDMKIKDPIKVALETDRVQEMENHAMLTSKDGRTFFLEDSAAPVHSDTGGIVGVVLVFRDVSAKREQLKKIEYLSFHDALTGLYNRRFFEEELRRLDTKRNLPISIIVGDVNDLKLTNDVFGHNYGDVLLERFGQVLRRVCRSDDIIARWGGDEYSLLLPRTGAAEVQKIITRVREEFSKEQVKAIKCSVSMGAATKENPEEELQEVVNLAEESMYQVKIQEHSQVTKATLDAIVQKFHESSQREREHAERVSRLCEAMGKAMGFSKGAVRRLRDAGYLHDIGKIVLDPKLLGNSYPHTTKEWNEIKRHPVTGYRILNSFDNMLDLAEIVLTHQERWDGTGYPKGLKGEEIPEAARLLALAESYERRVYGSGNMDPASKEEALKAIEANKGKHFDPGLTDIFLEMMKKEEPELDLDKEKEMEQAEE
jgi:diguanylate cyclase (GGDEF)-like protein/PAS domain S-box-containing protein